MTAKKGKYVEICRHKNSTYRIVAQPQKRGAKSYHTGSRLAFLEGYLDEYVALHGKSRHKFWHKLFEAWWPKYPWCLPDVEEPPVGDPEKMQELSEVRVDADEKAEVEARVRNVSSFVENF